MVATPKLDIDLLTAGGDGNEILVNEALLAVEAQISIKDRDLAAPPGSPTNGDGYIVAASGTGDWSGQEGNLAFYADGWLFIAPFEGLEVWVDDEDHFVYYDGTNWSARDGAVTLSDAANIDWDVSDGASAQVTLGGNRTLNAPTNFNAGQTLTLRVIQDGTGSRTITWNALFKWAGGTAPTLSTGVGAIDVFTFFTDGTDWYGSTLGLNYS